MEIIRACGLNIFLETAPVRREMVWESVTPPGDMLVIDAEVTADIPAHASDAEEFAIVVSGRFEVTMNGETLPCGPGDHLVVEAGVEHAIRVVEPGRLVLIGKM